MTSDDLPECPLCMVELFYDDLGFYPCSCGYQICRFCWSRILNEENGLCPACRCPYDSEAPASFTPLSEEQFQKLKKEKRNKERRNKTVENRKHLADIRVVQKNLAFVIGLPQRFADTQEILKGPDYFGKYGKVFKVVVNRNAAQPGSQGQGTAGAYVTFVKHEDAIRAILDLNKQQMEGRTLKASLGTTKYCSQFLKGATCTKHECMYLHELGEEAASFTKEEMQQNKHTEYERKLIDEFIEANASIERSLLLSSTSSQHHQAQPTSSEGNHHHTRQPHTSECRDHSSSSSNSNTPPASRRATKSESQKNSHSQQQSAPKNQQQNRAAQNSNSQSASAECPSQRTPRKTSQSHKQTGHHQSSSQSRQSPPQQHQRNRQSHQLHNQQQLSRKLSSHSADETRTRQPQPSEDDQQFSQQVQLSESLPVQLSQPPQLSQPSQSQQQELQPQQQELQQQQLHLQQQQLQLLQQHFQQKQQQHHLQQSEGSATDLRLTSLPPGLGQQSVASHLLSGGCGPLGDSDQLLPGSASTTGSVSSSSASLHLLSSSLSLTTSSSVLNGLNCNYSLPPMYSLQFLHDQQQQQQSDLSSTFEAHRLARSTSLTEKSTDADAAALHTEQQYQSLNRASRWPAAASSAHNSPAEVMFCPKDDDAGLDFDPVKESQQGLAALIEDERSLPGGGHPPTTSAANGSFMGAAGPTGMAPPPGFEGPAFSAPIRSAMRAGPSEMIPGFPFFPGGLGQRLASGIDMGVHGSDSDSVQHHLPAHSQDIGGLTNHLGAAPQQHQGPPFGPSLTAAVAAGNTGSSNSQDFTFSVKALQDTLRCILPEETTITFDPSFMHEPQPAIARGVPPTSDHEGLQTSSASTKDPIRNEFNPFWPTSSSNSKPGRLENEITLRSEMVWSSPTTPPGFGSSVLSLLGGLGNGSTAVDVDGQRAVNVDRHTSVTATGDQQIPNQL